MSSFSGESGLESDCRNSVVSFAAKPFLCYLPSGLTLHRLVCNSILDLLYEGNTRQTIPLRNNIAHNQNKVHLRQKIADINHHTI